MYFIFQKQKCYSILYNKVMYIKNSSFGYTEFTFLKTYSLCKNEVTF
jgi:hypothetical protein